MLPGFGFAGHVAGSSSAYFQLFVNVLAKAACIVIAHFVTQNLIDIDEIGDSRRNGKKGSGMIRYLSTCKLQYTYQIVSHPHEDLYRACMIVDIYVSLAYHIVYTFSHAEWIMPQTTRVQIYVHIYIYIYTQNLSQILFPALYQDLWCAVATHVYIHVYTLRT